MKAFARRASRTSVKLIAAAACVAAAAPVHAQSSVSLYGQVDEWIGATKFPGGDRAWNVSGGGMSTSYWGMHGA
ncbi:porin, partial [Burkholderia multivorans]